MTGLAEKTEKMSRFLGKALRAEHSMILSDEFLDWMKLECEPSRVGMKKSTSRQDQKAGQRDGLREHTGKRWCEHNSSILISGLDARCAPIPYSKTFPQDPIAPKALAKVLLSSS